METSAAKRKEIRGQGEEITSPMGDEPEQPNVKRISKMIIKSWKGLLEALSFLYDI